MINKNQIFKKAGTHNYKEKQLLKKIIDVLEEKMKTNPEIIDSIKPATNLAELQAMYQEFGATDVKFEEIVDKDSKTDNVTPSTTENTEGYDPFNREDTKVRDYVLDGQQNTIASSNDNRTTFAEPLTSEEAFEIPEESTDPNNVNNKSAGNNVNQQKSGQNIQKTQGNSDGATSMSAQRKNTAKFAKYLVEAVSLLQEKGFVWYANKDINEAKLAEYELSGEMDLSLILTLDDSQEVSIKEFFRRQCDLAEQAAKIDPQQKADLTEALTEVLLEKNIGPTKSQNLMIVGISILMTQGLSLLAITSQNKAVLSQLRSMNEQNIQGQRASSEQLRREEAERQRKEEERIANAEKVAKGEKVEKNTPPPAPEAQVVEQIKHEETKEPVFSGPIINVPIERQE